ncbi:Anti-sigma-K factor RskA [Georgenia satyanarayanai]|uniref:Regulator of SigK n=1 Tax=Georgenia satyanarayanai TaxID=860221 RepID=A0A2Y9C7G9_9MICO|nr:anti-sigma factor [Georgenia satyanarayanai]PYF97813.1 anti-sigma-K factor RskA [Georgenia satyanarayanai]SSA45553.1 Anti-sigma-K factor RskA [Georgenia satyanarayanai]
MREDEVRELLPAWALDAVTPEESAAVDRAVAADPALAEEARALREVAALLATGASVPPPASLRADVLDRVARTPQEGTGTDAPAEDDGVVVDLARVRARRRDRWLVAAVVLAAAALPGVIAVQQYERATQAEEQLTTVAEALAEPGAELLAADVAGGGRAVAVVGSDTSVFSARDLPSLASEEVYQLWVVDDGGARSAGVLTVAAGRASAELADLPDGATIAMTVEPAGGSTQPTSDPVVALAASG